jgi:drug/metabolite transporter (DMT)-like permease
MTYLKLLLTAVFWGGTFIAGRILAGHVAPFAAAFLRFTLAAGLLLLILHRRHGRLPAVPPDMRLRLVVLGLTGVFIYNVFFFWGLQYIPAGRAAVIIANNPVMIALGAALAFGIRLDRVQSAGVLISVSGAVLAISGGHPIALFKGGLGWGDLLIFGCTLSWAAFSLVGKTVVARIPPLTAIAYSAIIGAALLLIPALIEGMAGRLSSYSIADWGSLAYLAVFGTVLGFVWFYEGIEKIGPTRAALFINFVPISALCLAWLILKEPLTWALAAGTVMVICGVYLTNNSLSLPLRLKKQTRVV